MRKLQHLYLAWNFVLGVSTNVCSTLLTYLLDSLALLQPALSSGNSISDSSILVVRLDAIGDFVLWQRFAGNLRRLYKNERIVLVANSAWAALADKLPYWDEVIQIDIRSFRTHPIYRLRMLLEIRRRRFSLVMQPTYSRDYRLGDAIVHISGARAKVGWAGDFINTSSLRRIIADRWYTRLIECSQPNISEFSRNKVFLQALGLEDYEVVDTKLPKVATLPSALRPRLPYFVVFPGASWKGRQWSEASFVAVIEQTFDRYGLIPVICGSKDEVLLCRRIIASAKVAIIDFSGRTSLPEFCELIRGARLVVSNETSAVHISSAVGTPAVCLLGGGHFGRFLPYPSSKLESFVDPVHLTMPCFGCNWKCTVSHEANRPVPCIDWIPVNMVNAAINRALCQSLC